MIYPYVDKIREFADSVRRRFDYIRAETESRLSGHCADPLTLYAVDPREIEVALQRDVLDDSWCLSPVIGGRWDREVENIENYDIVYSLENHFRHGAEWTETDLYSRALSCLEGEREWIGHSDFSDMEELNMYLEKIDQLYQKIRSQGYSTQRELSTDENLSFWTPNSTAYERHEVTVHLDRKGDLILEDGWHRFAIARALGLELIPVRVAARHRDGQSKLEKLPKY